MIREQQQQQQQLSTVFKRPAGFNGTALQYEQHVIAVVDAINHGREVDTTGIPESHLSNAMQMRFGGQ